jgi:branched-chain amino acid transport system substrate-binding protein
MIERPVRSFREREKTMEMISRRRVLQGLAAGAALASPLRAIAQSADTLKIGLLTDMSGPLSQAVGPGAVVAARMAIEKVSQLHPEIKVDLDVADMQNKTDLVVSISREWLDNKGFDVITEVPNSAGVLALAPLLADRDKVGLFTSSQSSKVTGSGCGSNSTQWMGDAWANSESVVDAQLKAGGKKWFFIAADTAFGQDVMDTAAKFVVKGGGTVVGSVKHPYPGNTEFSSYLLQAQASGADVIGIANSGPDAVNCIKQAAEFGIIKKGQKIAGLSLDVLAIRSIGLDIAQGVVVADSFYWDFNDQTRDFTKKFKARHGDIPTSQQACQYSALVNYLNAVAVVGVAEAKKSGRAVLKQMRAGVMDDQLFGPTTLREDGRTIRRMLVLETKSPEQSKSKDDICAVLSEIPGDKAFRPLSEGGCPLIKS